MKMKITLKKKNRIMIALSFLLVILFAVGVYFGLRFFWLKKADINPLNYISNTANISYHVGDQAISDTSNTLRVQKVDLFNLNLLLQGRLTQSLNGIDGTMTVINPDLPTDAALGDTPFVIGSSGQSKPDWTTISAITDLSKRYDLRISIGGYLPKKIQDVNLEHVVSVNGGTLLAGNVNGDNIINYTDYSEWKDRYGQSVDTKDKNDFNGDGVINYLDFAIAYGSGNWMKTEANQ